MPDFYLNRRVKDDEIRDSQRVAQGCVVYGMPPPARTAQLGRAVGQANCRA